jgi:hypothetical protein
MKGGEANAAGTIKELAAAAGTNGKAADAAGTTEEAAAAAGTKDRAAGAAGTIEEVVGARTTEPLREKRQRPPEQKDRQQRLLVRTKEKQQRLQERESR